MDAKLHPHVSPNDHTHDAATANAEGQRLYARIVEETSTGVIVTDARLPDGPIVFVNAAFTHLTGYTEAETLGRNPRFLQGRDTDKEDVDRIRQALQERRGVHITLRNYHKDGSPFWFDMAISPVHDADGQVTHFMAIQTDSTERVNVEERLAYQAFHDALTELPNRALFTDRLDHALARAMRQGTLLSVLFLDLDRFKIVNDSLGHEMGDRLLVAVAKRLCGLMRSGDTVARFGGDEFVMLFEELTGPDDALRAVERILAAFVEPFTLENDLGAQEVAITVSAGITFNHPDESAQPDRSDDLLRAADTALHRAKERGKARYEVFDGTMRTQAIARLESERALRGAIERGELRVQYQPQVAVIGGAIIGFEALVRWEHPTRGLVLPEDFVALAEETGMIVPLGWWVLTEACRQGRAWYEQFGSMAPAVSVNLSARQLREPDIVASVARTLADTGLPPHRLVLEITEHVMMAGGATTAVLHALRAQDVRLAIDNFGTGYSSLAYLKELPIHILKLDRAFIAGLTGEGGASATDTAIVRAVVQLAHSLGLLTIGEGVETAGHLHQLRFLGCDFAQGFAFAPSLSPAAATDYLTRSLEPHTRNVNVAD